MPHKISWSEWHPKEHLIFGQKPISLDELQIILSSKIPGTWTDNYWNGPRGIEFRVLSRIALLGRKGEMRLLKNRGSDVNLETWLHNDFEGRATVDLTTSDEAKSQSVIAVKKGILEFGHGYEYKDKDKWRAVFLTSGFQWVR